MSKAKKVVLGIILGVLILSTTVAVLANGKYDPNADPDEPIFATVQTHDFA